MAIVDLLLPPEMSSAGRFSNNGWYNVNVDIPAHYVSGNADNVIVSVWITKSGSQYTLRFRFSSGRFSDGVISNGSVTFIVDGLSDVVFDLSSGSGSPSFAVTDNQAGQKSIWDALANGPGSTGATVRIFDGVHPADAEAPSVTIDPVADGFAETKVTLGAILAGGTYDGLPEYLWSVDNGTLDDETSAAPTWTCGSVTEDEEATIGLSVTVRGTGSNAKDGTEDVGTATPATTTVKFIAVITKIATPPGLIFRVGEEVDVILPSAYDGLPPFSYALEDAQLEGAEVTLAKGLDFDPLTLQLRGKPVEVTPKRKYRIKVTGDDGLPRRTDDFPIEVAARREYGPGSYRPIHFRIALKIYPASAGGGRGWNFWNGAGQLTLGPDTYEPGILNSTDSLQEIAQGRKRQATVQIGAEQNTQLKAYLDGDPGVRLMDLFLIHRFGASEDWDITSAFVGARMGRTVYNDEIVALEVTNDLDTRTDQIPDEFSDEFQSANYGGDRFFINLKRMSEGVTVVF